MQGHPWEALWRSRKFWLAVVAMVQTVIFTLIPGFPEEVWQAINIILLWLIGTIAVEDAAGKMRDARDERRMTSDE
jgi:type III secretory pathway component EscV